jgi:hypothetical protein
MESQQFESHSAETNTVSEALALREILEALKEVCSVGQKAWWANFQILTPISETYAVRVKDSYLESRHDLPTSVAYLSPRGHSIVSEPHIWTVANEFFRLCGELDDVLKLQTQPAESMLLVVNSLEPLNKAVSRAKRLIEISPWKGAAITFRFDKNIKRVRTTMMRAPSPTAFSSSRVSAGKQAKPHSYNYHKHSWSNATQ